MKNMTDDNWRELTKFALVKQNGGRRGSPGGREASRRTKSNRSEERMRQKRTIKVRKQNCIG